MSYQDKLVKRVTEMYAELGDKEKRLVLDKIRYDNILKAAEEVNKTKTVYFGEVYAEVVERQKYFNVFEGFKSGLRYFDNALMGLRAGELIVIAGPSNYGKTMVAMNLVISSIVACGKKALIISMEMPAIEVASRAYNMTDDHEALMENLIIQTELSVSTRHIAAMIERHQPDLLLLDHIQFLANQEDGKEYERINAAVAKLKRLAINYKLPIVSISHVAKTRSGKEGEATANDLKGSSSIEQDCDVGFMINRLQDSEEKNEVILTLFKHRTKHPTIFHKSCHLRFDGLRLANSGDYGIDQLPEEVPKQWSR